MNATTIALPSWTADIQHYSQKAIFYTPIVWGAFKKTLAPVIIESLKGIALYLAEREGLWRQWTLSTIGITHNPLQASFDAAIAELTSAEAQATYARIRHIVREAATDALVIGLCGVVAIAEGVEFAQKTYHQAKAAYARVDSWLNPAGPEPMILPTVEMAIAPHQESALQQEQPLEDVQALIAEDEEYERQFMARLEQLDADALATVQVEAAIVLDEVCQPNGVVAYVPVLGPITNPEPTDMHLENIRIVAKSIPAEVKAAETEDLATALHVPGAKGAPKRNTRGKAKTSKGDAEATASTPKRRRVTKK